MVLRDASASKNMVSQNWEIEKASIQEWAQEERSGRWWKCIWWRPRSIRRLFTIWYFVPAPPYRQQQFTSWVLFRIFSRADLWCGWPTDRQQRVHQDEACIKVAHRNKAFLQSECKWTSLWHVRESWLEFRPQKIGIFLGNREITESK